ncbi:hypothetical protein GmHk_03G006525 [Glycine max]|nr:hypothetical protein GmHk_03G006525 [Glycine max]
MPFPFDKDFQGKGVLEFSSASDSFSVLLHNPQPKWTIDKEDYCYVGRSTEPTSVLDTREALTFPRSQQSVDFNAGFGVVDQGLNMVSVVDPSGNNTYPGFPFIIENIGGRNVKAGFLSIGELMFFVSGNSPLLFSTSLGGFNSQQQHQVV